jgi:hypothetical protein
MKYYEFIIQKVTRKTPNVFAFSATIAIRLLEHRVSETEHMAKGIQGVSRMAAGHPPWGQPLLTGL